MFTFDFEELGEALPTDSTRDALPKVGGLEGNKADVTKANTTLVSINASGSRPRGDAHQGLHRIEWFEVIFEKVFVKKSPNKDDKSWGWLTRGQKIQVMDRRAFDADGHAWVELTPFEIWRSCQVEDYTARGFAIIDAYHLGLRQLLDGPLSQEESLLLDKEVAEARDKALASAADITDAAAKGSRTLSERPAPGAQLVRGLGMAGPVPRRIGEGLWRCGPLQALPDCSFFPRIGYVALPLTSGAQAYVLGGQREGRWFNDVWLVQLSASGAGWFQLSSHEEPRRLEAGASATISAKWAGRERFSAAVGTRKPGCMALYVCGGRNGIGCLSDVWASENSGSTWYCMTQDPPFGARVDAGLVTVPGRYTHLVLCGGWKPVGPVLTLRNDMWVSIDAGMQWEAVQPASPWQPRGVPLLVFVGAAKDYGSRRLLVLGGTGYNFPGSGMDERMLSNEGMNERMLPDAWECDLNVTDAQASWRSLGNIPEESDPLLCFSARTAGFDHCASRSFSLHKSWQESGMIIAKMRREIKMAPPPFPRLWRSTELFDGAGKPVSSTKEMQRFQCLALVSMARAQCPRLLVFTENGASATGVRELRWQRNFLEWLGRALDRAGVLPEVMFAQAVVPALLPQPKGMTRSAR